MYYPSWKNEPKPVPFEAYIGIICLLSTITLSIPIHIQMKKIQQDTLQDFGAVKTRLTVGLSFMLAMVMYYFMYT